MTDPEPRSDGAREPVSFLVFYASLRAESLNRRLALLAAQAIEADGGVVDFRPMTDFDCPSYNADVRTLTASPPARTASATASRQMTPSSSARPSTTPRCPGC